MFEASLGPPQHHENLTIFPVLAAEGRDLPHTLMAEALAMGILTIREKDGGQVPLLLATNAGLEPVLILDGEQLIGAKQNRMTNRTILLAPESTTEIPVSCMEQGRWHAQGEHFAPAPQNAPSKVRRKARETEARASYAAEARGPGARSSHRDLASAQGEVWDEIQTLGYHLGGVSETGALDSLYHHRRGELPHWIRAFPLILGQVGLVAFQGKAALGMDAVGSPTLYGKVHDRILTGYVLDAMEGRARDQDQEFAELRFEPTPSPYAERFIQEMKDAQRIPSESVGMGEYRILRGNVIGGELADDGRMVHLSAFPTFDQRTGRGEGPSGHAGPRPPQGRPIAPPSRRRRGF